MLGHININSIRNKFITVHDIIKPNLNIFSVNETNLIINIIVGYRMFRMDMNSYGGAADHSKLIASLSI